jgi:hypothetical protein
MGTRSRRILASAVVAGASLAVAPSAAAATPAAEATCVGLASAFFGQTGLRADVAHTIMVVFGIPSGAEVSRFAHVRLGDTAACIEDGQSGGA